MAESSIQMASSRPGSHSLRAVSGGASKEAAGCVTGLALTGVVTTAAPQSRLGEKRQEMVAGKGGQDMGTADKGTGHGPFCPQASVMFVPDTRLWVLPWGHRGNWPPVTELPASAGRPAPRRF